MSEQITMTKEEIDKHMDEEYAIAIAYTLSRMTISQIADQIRHSWVDKQGKNNIYFAAKPYVEAMEGMTTINDNYGYDNGRDVVTRFLCNASSWKGVNAKAVKKELNKRLKAK